MKMKSSGVRTLLGFALASVLTLISASLFAQVRVPVHVPVGPPMSAASQMPFVPNGPLPSPRIPSPSPFLTVGSSFDGIDFLGSNCGCLPPDTNAAVGNGFVAETVNIQFRVFNTGGTVLLDETLQTLFVLNDAGAT